MKRLFKYLFFLVFAILASIFSHSQNAWAGIADTVVKKTEAFLLHVSLLRQQAAADLITLVEVDNNTNPTLLPYASLSETGSAL